MKFYIVFSLCISVILLQADSVRFDPKPVSPRKIEIGKQIQYTPIVDSKINMEIVIPVKPDQKIRKAADEFCSLMGKIFNSKFKCTHKESGKKFVVYLGYAPKDINLDRDGFIIRTGKNRLEILGDREGEGLKYGVYDFLERFTGTRFYFPGKYGTILPQKKNLRLPEINIMDRPDFQYRKIRWMPWTNGLCPVLPWYEDGNDEKAALLRHNQYLRLSVKHIPNVHGLTQLGLVQRFAKTHPEYFALNAKGERMDGTHDLHYWPNKFGQYCFSAKGLQEEVYQDAVAALTGKSAKTRNIVNVDNVCAWGFTQRKPFFNISPNDGMTLCHCPECWKTYKTHPNSGGKDPLPTSEKIWKWVIDIAGRLQKNGIPGYVTSSAYAYQTPLPRNPEFPKNMVIQLCINGPWSEQQKNNQAKDDALVKAWANKIGTKIYIWTYPTKGCLAVPTFPNTTPRATASYYSRQFKYTFGSYFEAESDCWLFGYLNYYVFAKMMWDKDVSADQLLKEHCQTMFGNGWEPMLNFFDSMEKHWMTFASHTVDTPIGPVGTPPSEFEIWNKIYSPAEMSRLNTLFDTALKRAKVSAEKERIQYIRRRFWGPVNNAAETYRRRTCGRDKWSVLLPRFSGKIALDGKADEPVWKQCQDVYLLPVGKDSAEVKTTVKMFRDAQNYYFFFDCQEPETSQMRLLKRKTDDTRIWQDSSLEFFLDTEGKRERYYQFMINANGAAADLFADSKKHSHDFHWKSGIQVKTMIRQGKGWTAEVILPQKNMMLPKQDFIHANFVRNRIFTGKKASEKYMWSCLASASGDISNFGRLLLRNTPEENLFTDGDFLTTGIKGKENPNGWYDWGSTLQRDTKIYRTGGVSIRMDGKHKNLVQRLPNLKPDTEYIFSFFAKLENIKNPGLRNEVGGFTSRMSDAAVPGTPNSVRWNPNPPYIGTMPWQYYEYRFRTSPKTGTLPKRKPVLYFMVPPGPGKAWVDHVSLQEVKK